MAQLSIRVTIVQVKGDGDDESLVVDLSKVSPEIEKDCHYGHHS